MKLYITHMYHGDDLNIKLNYCNFGIMSEPTTHQDTVKEPDIMDSPGGHAAEMLLESPTKPDHDPYNDGVELDTTEKQAQLLLASLNPSPEKQEDQQQDHVDEDNTLPMAESIIVKDDPTI